MNIIITANIHAQLEIPQKYPRYDYIFLIQINP